MEYYSDLEERKIQEYRLEYIRCDECNKKINIGDKVYEAEFKGSGLGGQRLLGELCEECYKSKNANSAFEEEILKPRFLSADTWISVFAKFSKNDKEI